MGAVPWVALAVAAGLSLVERKLEEEALLDASPWRVLVRVSLRRALGGVLAAAAWVAVIAATEIAVSDLYQIRTFSEEIYCQAALGPLLSWSGDESLPVAVPPPSGGVGGGPGLTPPSFATSFALSELAVGVTALALLVLAALWLMAGWLPPAASIANDAGWKWRPARGRAWLATGVWLLVGVAVLAPLAGLAWKAGIEVRQEDKRYEQSWSATKAAAMVVRSPWEHRREWAWSLAIGTMAAAGATALGLASGWLVRVRSSGGAALAAAIALGLAVPAPLLGVWVIALLNQPPDSALAPLAVLYDRTLTAPVLVQMVRALPLAALWMWSQLASVPQDLLDAAESEGAGRTSQLVRIAMPLRRAGVAAGIVAALVVALAEVSATLLVLPPGVTTVPVLVFQLLHYGIDDRLAALCLSIFVLLGAGLAIMALGRRIAERGRRRVPEPLVE
jgi:iron(III) transport system permease protein